MGTPGQLFSEQLVLEAVPPLGDHSLVLLELPIPGDTCTFTPNYPAFQFALLPFFTWLSSLLQRLKPAVSSS